jgi:cephalosporin-C deacetylase-like acetyl esterase
LHPQLTGSIAGKGYTIEKLIYESFPKHHVTANLYIPTGKGPFPAVLLFCGHAASAKVADQQTAMLFANNGFVVLIPDPISQGERYQLTDSTGKPLTRGGTTEHTLLNIGSALIGTNIVAYELWDNIRALDYLITRHEVDSSRIGCLGNSGGGTQTAYMMAFDKRIKVAAPCSFITLRQSNFVSAGAPDGCQIIPFEGREKLEITDYMIMFAPKPALILAGYFDFVDWRGTLEVYKELGQIYTFLEKPDQISLFTYDDGHGMSKPKREVTVTWFRKWLCNDPSLVIEKESQAISEKELNCTLNGSVNAAYPDEIGIQQRNLAIAYALKKNRADFFKSTRNEFRDKIRNVLGLEKNLPEVSIEVSGKENNGYYQTEKIIIHRHGEIPIPCLMLIPEKKEIMPEIIVIIDEKGKKETLDHFAEAERLLKSGNIVLLTDLRGFGETTPKEDPNAAKYYNRDYTNAMLALHIGKPLIGEQVMDIFSVLDYLATEPRLSGHPVKLMANGEAVSVAALHAIALDDRIGKIEINRCLKSWISLLDDPLKKDVYPLVLPSVLKYYDIPDLINFIGKEKVKTIN